MKSSSYSKEDLARAIDEYNNGAISSAITAKYEIPASTIRNHKSDSKLGIGSGCPKLLSNEQEKYLVEVLKNLELIGVRLTKPVVIELASDYIERVTGKVDKVLEVGRKWLNNFNYSNTNSNYYNFGSICYAIWSNSINDITTVT